MSKPTTYFTAAGFRCLRNIKRQTDDLYLVHCGHQQCKPGYTYDHKIPNEFHLHFVLNGKGSLTVNNTTYSIKKDDLFLIPKGQKVYYEADNHEPWEYMWVTFDGDKAIDYLRYMGFANDRYVICSSIPTACYQPLITKTLDSNQLTIANEIKRVGYLYEIITMLIESQNSAKSRRNLDYSNKTYVEHALQFISVNYDKITINDIAKYVGINRSYLSTIFKEELNISPQEFLIDFRLKKAADLLGQTNLSIQEIATEIGYQNSCSFSKTFKRIYGENPTDYRRNQSKTIQ